MNERRIIESLHEKYQAKEGSRPCEVTPLQQRVANIAGRLLVHAHRRGKRKKGKWI